jgi:hypothetical protein
MKKLLFIVMILTLSSCMVSKKVYDKKCCEVDELKAQLKSDKAVYDYQDELCRRVAYELQLQLDTCKAKKDTLTDEEIKKLF